VDVLKFHFDKSTTGLPCRLSPSLDLRPVAANLEGYSSRRLKDIVNLSLTLLAAEALQDDRKEFITAEHILRAAQQIPRGDGTPASSQKTGQKASFWRRLGFGR
jgi:hypothetical protein